jgi:hypothetical protein
MTIEHQEIQRLDSTIKDVANAYGFTISFCDVLEKIIITSRKANFRYDEFYWDSTESKEDFFDELKNYFIRQGEENRY